ncbi:MAG: PIG-L family deacetylase [Pleurocapsa minor GSE-CHR-MK-17-07R]|jgi:LmbE family N-acetylglucosaminyl deacetylase|nr:PIG-L family deacetylase [Pleurocapsa minor GSE-CHR-MK 17-07R]
MAIPLEAPITGPFKILVIVAHPDDIEFGAGGSVAVWTDAGAEVVYCIVTDGSAGSNDPTMKREDLILQRQNEQRAAAAHVGVTDVRFLGYQDGVLQPTIELRKHLTRLIREIRPDRVVIMDPTSVLLQRDEFAYINHPDHRAVGEASLYAVFPSAETRPIFPELLDEGLEPHHVWELYLTISAQDQIAVDISGVFERKIRALLEHKSQLGPEIEEMIRQWDVRAGAEAGVPMAETFRVMRFGERVIAPRV